MSINQGDRLNSGIVSDNDDYERSGVVVGLVGPRMNKNCVMESQELRVTEEQNTRENGYGGRRRGEATVLNLFADFYNIDHLPKYTELHNSDSIQTSLTKMFKKSDTKKLLRDYKEITGFINTPAFLNIPAYNQRNRIIFEMLLAEANHRARSVDKRAYVHVVGLGLGVWKIYKDQNILFITEFIDTVSRMKPDQVSDVDFSWITLPDDADLGVEDGDLVPGTNIRIHFSKRNPWDKFQGDDRGKLVVASWAWDGMSFVGNEYWAGSLSSSSDPAAACCTQVTILIL